MNLIKRVVCWFRGHIGFEEWVGGYPGLNGWQSMYRFTCERCGKCL